MTYFFYVLQSETTGRFYIGHTQNLIKRVFEHNNNRTDSTKNRGPWVLFYSEEYSTRAEAAKREREVKRMKSRNYIQTLARASR